ncbi:TPA: trehalose-6-phosphate synthase [Candidatus Micrarchaeota archaeon]|nr:trehalose-6-phosphate synthase [Candidatus Micrarchaeota archaeon]
MKKEFLKGLAEKLGGHGLVVASFREPYTHVYDGEELRMRKNSGGVVTALDPLMKSLGGKWVAFGLEEADRETVNDRNECAVKSPEGDYTLKRVFISKTLEEKYSSGACNSALWPLAHMVYVRPKFVDEEWEAYKQANKLVAQTIAETCGEEDTVWINDYQLLLVASFLKKLKPKVTTAFYPHIPWPAASVISICPWAEELMEGMLAHDVVGFQTNYYAANFLNTVDAIFEARVDRVDSSAQYQGKKTKVVANPISIDYDGVRDKIKGMPSERIAAILKKYGVKKNAFAIGVDRMDYTKGIKEKLLAVDTLIKKHPEYVSQFTLLQIASPTRMHIGEYQRAAEEVEELAEHVNWEHSTSKWKPIRLVNEFVDYEEILALYSASNMCVITSLDDGMNLVSKEYVAASDDGVLVLSEFTGASLELKGAITANPYSLSSIANAMHAGLQMEKKERTARLEQMHREIQENDVFHWADKFITEIDKERRRKNQGP